jgi:hypothetical protein
LDRGLQHSRLLACPPQGLAAHHGAEQRIDRPAVRDRLLVGLLFVLAACVGAVGPFYVVVAGLCENGCASTDETLLLGAVPLALTWTFLYPAVTGQLRLAGRRKAMYGKPAALLAALLAAYAVGVGAFAWELGSHRTISGDGAWLSFWTGAFLGWILLGAVLARLTPKR